MCLVFCVTTLKYQIIIAQNKKITNISMKHVEKTNRIGKNHTIYFEKMLAILFGILYNVTQVD
jgi:hypothetical protein